MLRYFSSFFISLGFRSSLTYWIFPLVSMVIQMESPVSTPAPPPLHLLASVGNSDIASPCEQLMVRTRSVAVNTSDVALSTEPECLGPCEPGTSVNLEGIVWQETEDGKNTVDVSITEMIGVYITSSVLCLYWLVHKVYVRVYSIEALTQTSFGCVLVGCCCYVLLAMNFYLCLRRPVCECGAVFYTVSYHIGYWLLLYWYLCICGLD